MDNECDAQIVAKNVRRLGRVMAVTLCFGLVMTVLSVIIRPWGTDRFRTAITYYGSYFAISAIALGGLIALKNRAARARPGARPGASSAQPGNALVFAALTALQLLCLYQKTISGYPDEGYLVWTIANLLVITLLNVNPVFLLVSMSAQFALIVAYESAAGKSQFLNLGVLVLITIVLAFTHWHLSIRDFRNVAALREANAKSDELLGNVLPLRVIRDLRERGTSEPERFENVSNLFTDLVDFTDISSGLAPEYLIGELSDLFCGFDCIIEKYGCTRIKTIGDAYMAVCGLPEADDAHAEKIVRAGLECVKYLRKRNERSPIKWTMRAGVHGGTVVAGIVGARRYVYDFFGDAVNIASRMEGAPVESLEEA
jgi:class 3 adenylate cyclase